MSTYSITLFVHIVSVLCIFAGFGLEWTATALLRRAKTSEEVHLWLRAYRLAALLFGPGLLIAILSGGYLASQIGAMKQGWIPATFIGIAIIAAFGFGLNGPRISAIRKAVPAGNEALSTTAMERLRNPLLVTSVRISALLGLGIVFLMVTKVTFLMAMLVFVCAAIVGFFFAVPAWLSK